MQTLSQNVTERVWTPASEPDFTDAMFAGTALADAAKRPVEQALAVYLDDTPTCVFGHLTEEHAPGLRNDFRQHWQRHAPQRFSDVVFVIDTYRLGLLRSRPVELNHDFQALPVVDYLLHESHGILLWHHQLENLYRLFEIRVGEAVAFRKGVNAKKAKIFNDADQMELAPGISLSDVIWERMIFGVTSYPSLRAARLLYNAANR